MAKIKIYGLRESLDEMKAQLSDVIHLCVIEALSFPVEKKFHRFIALETSDFLFPADKSARYTIIEISMMEGRATETKKRLIYLLFERAQRELGLLPHDLEITITETPKCNWGFRGQTGDEIALNYKVEV